MSSSLLKLLAGYFTSQGAATSATASKLLLPVANAKLLQTINWTSLLQEELEELHLIAASIVSAPSPLLGLAAVPTLLAYANLLFGLESGLRGIWVHGEPSSTNEPGF